MKLLGFALFIFGFISGAWAMNIWQATFEEVKKRQDEETIREQALEIRRLRAQVAELIGRE